MKTQNMGKSLVGLRGMIFIVGIALFGISVMCNFLLYSSFSDDMLYKSTYSSMGIAFDVAKLCMAFSLGFCFYALRAYIFAAIAASFWTLLTLISIISAFGFMAVVNNTMESAALVSSTVFKSTEAALDSVQTKLNGLSQYADSALATQAQRKVDSLNTQLETFKQSSNNKKVSDEEEIPDHFLKKTTEQALERGDISCNQNDISNYLDATFNVQPELKVINGWMKEWFVDHPST